MKAIQLYETIDNVNNVFTKYMKDPKFRTQIITTAFRNGYVVHGTDADFDTFSPEYVKGGVRANYGYGFYFTNSVTKFADYGSDPSKYKFCNINDMRLLDLSLTPSEIGFKTIQDNISHLQLELHQIDTYLDNVRNNREYEYYTEQREQIERDIETLNKGRGNNIIDFIELYISKYHDETFEVINKMIINKIPTNVEKSISEYYKSLGFDGFMYGYEYVIFNYEKLNKYIVKDNKSFVYEISQEV